VPDRDPHRGPGASSGRDQISAGAAYGDSREIGVGAAIGVDAVTGAGAAAAAAGAAMGAGTGIGPDARVGSMLPSASAGTPPLALAVVALAATATASPGGACLRAHRTTPTSQSSNRYRASPLHAPGPSSNSYASDPPAASTSTPARIAVS
jgi:hypothetical protein